MKSEQHSVLAELGANYQSTSRPDHEPPPSHAQPCHRWLAAPGSIAAANPPWVVYTLLSAIIATAAITLSSHLYAAVHVNFRVLNSADAVLYSTNYKDFSVWKIVDSGWNAGAYYLSSLMFTTSLIWPYVKLILLAGTLLAPTRLLSEHRRGQLVRVLDMLGKWALVDVFVGLVLREAFFVTIYIENDRFLQIRITLAYGIYGYLLATLVSLVLLHTATMLHRNAVEKAVGFQAGDHSNDRHVCTPRALTVGDSKEAVAVWQLRMEHATAFVYEWRPRGAGLLAAALVAAMTLIVAGATIDSSQVEFGGLILLLIPNGVQKKMTLIRTAVHVSELGESGALIELIQASFWLFTFVIPLTHLVSLVFVWLVPLRGVTQRKMYLAAEVLHAWSCVEVYIVSVVVVLLEIGTIVTSVFGTCSDAVSAELEQLVPQFAQRVKDSDLECVSVSTRLLEGCWLLFVAALYAALLREVVTDELYSGIKGRGWFPTHEYDRCPEDTKPQGAGTCFHCCHKSRDVLLVASCRAGMIREAAVTSTTIAKEDTDLHAAL
eukprot:TRINITY_DN9827_c0_g1_i1.p1 TRINITY_DN9827_c0_g1~~TRINITY_DN9827_c0_g1_i1.p1  ORF type:complete len:548 (+),score=89.35 TRINITY_DN9827_c0_g1_i1:214-1857(+)